MKKIFILITNIVFTLNLIAQPSNTKDTLHFNKIEEKFYSVKIENGKPIKNQELSTNNVSSILQEYEFLLPTIYLELKRETIYFDKNQNHIQVNYDNDSIRNVYNLDNLIQSKYEYRGYLQNGDYLITKFGYKDKQLLFEVSHLASKVFPQSIKHYHYDSKSQIDYIEYLHIMDATIFEQHILNDGLDIKELLAKDDPNNQLIGKENFIYSENDRLIEKVMTMSYGKESSKYNNAGKLERVVQEIDNEQYTSTYTYNNTHRLIRFTRSAIIDSQSEDIQYSYEGDDLSSIKVNINDKNAMVNFSYKYDDHGNWIEKVISIDGVTLFIVTRAISYYKD